MMLSVLYIFRREWCCAHFIFPSQQYFIALCALYQANCIVHLKKGSVVLQFADGTPNKLPVDTAPTQFSVCHCT